MRFQGKTSLIFLFYCGTVSRKTDEKMLRFFWFFGIKKWNCLMVSYMKLTWNYETAKFSQEKMKLTARGFAAAVSFNFFSWPNLDGFIISVSFMYETTASFIFWAKKQKKSQHFPSVSRETGHKKKVRFIPKTVSQWIS